MSDNLHQKLRDAHIELGIARSMVAEAKALLARCEREAAETGRKLAQLTPEVGPLLVTDHAIVRYINHMMGLDVEQFRTKITEDPDLLVMVNRLGDGIYPVRNEHRVVVRNRKVVTVQPKKYPHNVAYSKTNNKKRRQER